MAAANEKTQPQNADEDQLRDIILKRMMETPPRPHAAAKSKKQKGRTAARAAIAKK
ncbi:MAG TPA: hypothetical protein VMF53_04465 [Alphaproteobacteria bacterium]|nr:hypothetical protein [Alphaproteobacteria bacterium]